MIVTLDYLMRTSAVNVKLLPSTATEILSFSEQFRLINMKHNGQPQSYGLGPVSLELCKCTAVKIYTYRIFSVFYTWCLYIYI